MFINSATGFARPLPFPVIEGVDENESQNEIN
jgi:hypothetical protein